MDSAPHKVLTSTIAARTLVLDEGPMSSSIRVQKNKLLVISGPLQGSEYVVNKEVFSIGSGKQNDLSLADSTISKRHCEISMDNDGQYTIKDLDSTNGTFVGGVRVNSAFLHPGAEFQIGKTKIIFCPLQESHEIPLSANESFGEMLGKSTTMRRIFKVAETYAPSEATVMITGETGTGKEILAEEIHKHSPRKDKPYIVIDCAAMSKDLVESELFGHVKGAFTGANADRKGAFENADGGTVFLDEIGDLSQDLQPKLLRVLEKREIKRVGDNKVRKIDVRIICATNRYLDREVNAGRFREDLYYRLSVVKIEIPPLRRRKDDIPMLVRKFVSDIHGDGAIKDLADLDENISLLKNHDWPGNVRELRNLVEAAFYSQVRPINLSTFLGLSRIISGDEAAQKRSIESAYQTGKPFKDAKNCLIEDFERKYIVDLLERNNGNVSRSAREADLERAYLQRLIKKYNLN